MSRKDTEGSKQNESNFEFTIWNVISPNLRFRIVNHYLIFTGRILTQKQ